MYMYKQLYMFVHSSHPPTSVQTSVPCIYGPHMHTHAHTHTTHTHTHTHTHRQMQELESRFNEAYSQSLSMKDERILVLERRLDDLSGDNEQLKDEASLLKRQNERLQRRNSVGSPSAAFGWVAR